jgi:MarR family transcriptional regulator, lower aerobic nicotinate degradation pathway regulator
MADVTGFLVNALGDRLREVTEGHLTDARIRPRQIGLVLVLRDEGALQQQELGERLAMDRTTTMRLVSELEEYGFVSREENPDDRRAYGVQLTSQGVRLAAQLEADVRAAQGVVLAPLSSAEAKTFHRLLTKLLVAGPQS